MPERGQCHGFTPFVLPTRSVGSRVDLGVLSTSNRKPPLRIPLRRVAEILTHPGQVEVVSPKRVHVLANERSDVAQRFVSNLVALGTSLGNDSVHLHHVPGHHGIVQYR
jgi:hypothetical protein